MRFVAIALMIPAVAAAVPVAVPHQGRLLDASGAPLQGSHALTFELRDGTGPGAGLLWRSTLTVDLSDGYYATVLDLDEDGQPLDSDVFADDTWLRVSSAAGLLGEQHVGTVPRAAVALSVSGAVVASGANVVQLGQSTASTCAADGSLIYDPDLEAVKLCVAGAWRVISSERGPRDGFESSGGAWRWDDGTSPSSCKGYLAGVAPVGRGSVPGNDAEDTGLYHITVGGTPRVVWCDMHAEGGGWTLTYAFGRTLSPTTVYSGQSGRFPQGDNWVMPRTDGVGWFLTGAPSTAWIVTVQPNCAQDPTCSNAFTVDRSEGQTDSWVWFRGQLGQNNVVVEYPDGSTYTEINWTAWDRGYNGGDDGARCGGHIWWYDYTTANPFYMPSRTSTACLHASGKAVFFWAR